MKNTSHNNAKAQPKNRPESLTNFSSTCNARTCKSLSNISRIVPCNCRRTRTCTRSFRRARGSARGRARTLSTPKPTPDQAPDLHLPGSRRRCSRTRRCGRSRARRSRDGGLCERYSRAADDEEVTVRCEANGCLTDRDGRSTGRERRSSDDDWLGWEDDDRQVVRPCYCCCGDYDDFVGVGVGSGGCRGSGCQWR